MAKGLKSNSPALHRNIITRELTLAYWIRDGQMRQLALLLSETPMNKATWQETDRFTVGTNGSGMYIIIEETEYLEIEDSLSHVLVRGQTRYRTPEGNQVHKFGKGFTFDTPFGTMVAERLVQEEKKEPPKWKTAE